MSTRDIKDSELLAVKNGLLQLGDAIETIVVIRFKVVKLHNFLVQVSVTKQ